MKSIDESLRLFLDHAGTYRLLDRDDEAALAQIAERGRTARRALEHATDPDERERLERIVADGERARREFVEANLRLVVSVARTFQGRGMTLPDLVQEGNTGLLRAVDGFDWRRGFKFSTYAVWWIRQAIQRALSEQGHSLRLSSSGADDLARVRATASLFEEMHQRSPTLEELATETDLSTERVRRVLTAIAPTASLDAPTTGHEGNDGDVLGAVLPDDAPPVEDIAERSTFRRVLERMMSVLDDRERTILRLRFGFDGTAPTTSGDIARRLHLSSERVRQIEARALSKLRHPSVEPEARFLLTG